MKLNIKNQPEYFKNLRDGAFISPQGVRSEFLYDFISRTKEKMVAVHEILDNNETVLQDLGSGLTVFPLSVYFTGKDAVEQADAFYESLFEKYTPDQAGIFETARWGNFNVFPAGEIQQVEDLVAEGGIIRFTLTLRETLSLNKVESEEITASIIEKSFFETVENAISSFEQGIGQVKSQYSILKGSIVSKVQMISRLIDAVVSIPADIAKEAKEIINDIYKVLDEGQKPAIAFMQIAQLTKTICDLPQGLTDTANSIGSLYSSIAESFVVDGSNSINTDEKITNAMFSQFLIPTLAVGVSLSLVNAQYSTREEAVKAIDMLSQMQKENTAMIDNIENTLQNVWQSDSNTQQAMHTGVLNGVKYLLLNAFSLRSAKKIKLTGTSDIITLCYEYYKKTDDKTLDFFIKTNNIKNLEFYQLNAGREVVIYV